MTTRTRIQNYWESRQPGLKHSKNEIGSREFFDEVERERYGDPFKYQYLKAEAEFDRYPNKMVLEIGLGLGTDILQFAKNGARVCGIDLTEGAVKLTQRRFLQEGLDGDFRQADFVNLPYEDNHFDLVYSFGVLHHSPETDRGVAEIFRVLKPGGKAIVMLYHKGFKYYVRKLFYHGVLKREYLSHSSREIVNRHSEDFGNCPLTRVFDRKEAGKMFAAFENIEMGCYRMDDQISWKGKIFSPTYHLLPRSLRRPLENKLGWNLLIKAKKPLSIAPTHNRRT